MAQREPELHDLIEVTWLDATGDCADHTIKDIREKKPYFCKRKTIGYFIFQDAEYVVFCGDLTLIHGNSSLQKTDTEENYTSLFAIPTGMTTSVRVLGHSQHGKRTRKDHI